MSEGLKMGPIETGEIRPMSEREYKQRAAQCGQEQAPDFDLPANTVQGGGVFAVRPGAALRGDYRYERARALDFDDARARVGADIEHVMSYRSWGPPQQRASDEVNEHLKRAMEAVVLNLPPCDDRQEAVRALSMVRMLVNRALTLGDAL